MASGGSDQLEGSNSVLLEKRVQPVNPRVQKEFCIKRVYKLMKSILPKDAQVTKQSKQYMVECAAGFISFITRKANYCCQLEQRDTITAEDLIDAMRKMGFGAIAEYSSRYNQHYHNFHGSTSGQYTLPPPALLPQDVQARVSGQYYALPPSPSMPQDVQARVRGQYYDLPPLPLPSHDVQARDFSMAPNFKFPNPIEMGTFFGVDDEVLPSQMTQDVQAISGRYYAPPLPPLPSQDVQAHNFSMAPNFKFLNPIEMSTFFGGDDGEELPPSLLSQDVQAYVSGQCAPPPLPPQDDQTCYFPMASNFKFPNPIEMGSNFGDDDTEGLPPPPPPLTHDVQAHVSGQYAPPPPPLPPQDDQARNFPMAPNFKFPNPIETGSYFADDDAEGLPPPPPLPPLSQDVQARVSGQYSPPPPSLDVQARYFPMGPNFKFLNPIEMSSFFGDDDGEELPPPPPLSQDVQARVSGQHTPPPPPLDVQAHNFPMDPNFKFPNPIEMSAFFGDDDGEELPPPPPPPQDVQARVSGQYAPPPPPPPVPPQDVQARDFSMAPNFMFPDPTEMGSLFRDGYGEELGGSGGGDGDGNSNDEGFDLIAFLNSYDK